MHKSSEVGTLTDYMSGWKHEGNQDTQRKRDLREHACNCTTINTFVQNRPPSRILLLAGNALNRLFEMFTGSSDQRYSGSYWESASGDCEDPEHITLFTRLSQPSGIVIMPGYSVLIEEPEQSIVLQG
jgi:hypothetical protein